MSHSNKSAFAAGLFAICLLASFLTENFVLTFITAIVGGFGFEYFLDSSNSGDHKAVIREHRCKMSTDPKRILDPIICYRCLLYRSKTIIPKREVFMMT